MKPVDCSLPETIMTVDRTAEPGIPIDAITAACSRADAVLHFLMAEFNGESDRRSADYLICNALWGVQGLLEQIRALALYGDATSIPVDRKGGVE
ncbi:hypothetical protein EGJ86_10395 [Pseudomonas sp. o96-267]|uniref:hypothetical protein n=1 Tax=Pseudomonas sp. o96-267 TaxID=2479853 RepID=UPI000F77766D|nr:hypothetical protein [Pseudomonas sp. o96-267]RRV39832.1 hypothetical protein EGJ86_10395 [Pseudomonas sp. o96-267]